MAKQFEPGKFPPAAADAHDTPSTTVEDGSAMLCGDCGTVVVVVTPCPDGGLLPLRCGCGAEIYAADYGR